MLSNTIKFIILIVCFVTTSLVTAERSFYLGLTAGQSLLDPGIGNTGLILDSDSDTGFKLYGGYDVTKNISIEGFWADLGQANFRQSNGVTAAGSIDYSAFGVEGVYYYPSHKKQFSGFAKAGLTNISNSSSLINGLAIERDGNVNLSLGVGAEYTVGDLFSLRAEYSYFAEDAQLVSVGVVKRFSTAYRDQSRVAASHKTPQPTLTTEVEPVVVNEPNVTAIVTSDETEVSEIVLSHSAFVTGSNAISGTTHQILDSFIASYLGNQQSRVTIDAYTATASNKQQMLQRARNVALYLWKNGVAKKSIRFAVKNGTANEVRITKD